MGPSGAVSAPSPLSTRPQRGPGPLFLDCADIYTGAEQLLGDWLAARPASAGQTVVFTKFVPDLDALATIDRKLRARHRPQVP